MNKIVSIKEAINVDCKNNVMILCKDMKIISSRIVNIKYTLRGDIYLVECTDNRVLHIREFMNINVAVIK